MATVRHHLESNMPAESRSTKCGECGKPLSEAPSIAVEQRTACPSCGSTVRAFSVTTSSTIEIYGQLRLKGRRASRGRPFIEQTVGSDLHRKTGIWMKLDRVIDRARDWYRERVTNLKTGEVVHECEEPLSQHQWHGTAKRRPTEQPLR
jgi:DNA-directed RNA polymerase subunit RPC12/RpoP